MSAYAPGDRVIAETDTLPGTVQRVIRCEGFDGSPLDAYVVQWDGQPASLLVYADWQLAPATQLTIADLAA